MRAHTFSFNLISKVKIRIFSKRKNELNDFWLLRRALFSRKEGKRYSLCITGRSKEVSEDVGWEISLGREWGKRSVVEILVAVFQTPFWSEENLRGRWCNEFSTIIASKVLNQKPFFCSKWRHSFESPPPPPPLLCIKIDIVVFVNYHKTEKKGEKYFELFEIGLIS